MPRPEKARFVFLVVIQISKIMDARRPSNREFDMMMPSQAADSVARETMIWSNSLPPIAFFAPQDGISSIFRTIRLKLGRRTFGRIQQLIGRARREQTAFVVLDADGHIWGFVPDSDIHLVAAKEGSRGPQVAQFDVRVF
jgi:hypothetical protein